jgi:deazaflavin-dependent oxidoreductase (nitroreductase family)
MAERNDNQRYVAPDWFTQNVLNPAVKGLTRLGISVWGSRILEVRGRSSGEWRAVPVNLLTIDGIEYLVAPRGHTQWVKNLRVAGVGRLRLGRRITEFTAIEVPVEDRLPILRTYLERWSWEVGQFFGGVGAEADDDAIRAIAPDHPVFVISDR